MNPAGPASIQSIFIPALAVLHLHFFFPKFKKMAENKSFWIKYLDNNPVEIETLYFNDQERKRPLKNVGHLISAYKVATLPRFENVPVDDLSLYLDGNTLEALRSDKLLAELPLIRYDNPLIIKSRNSVGNFYIAGNDHNTRIDDNDREFD